MPASGTVDTFYTGSVAPGKLPSFPTRRSSDLNDQTKAYGAALPALTASYSGFVNGDTDVSLTTAPTLTTSAHADSHVAGNPYLVTAAGAVDADYTIHYVAGTLTVTPVGLTITADSKAK